VLVAPGVIRAICTATMVILRQNDQQRQAIPTWHVACKRVRMQAPKLTNPWMRLAVFNTEEPALALGAHLQKQGVDVRMNDERNLQRFWFLTRPRAGYSVEVQEASFAAVQDRMDADPRMTSLLQEAIRCPSCNSLRVEYPQMTRKNILPTLLAHVFMAVNLMKPQCYCEACHFTWRPKRQNRADSRFASRAQAGGISKTAGPTASH
jgi:hypothetical protein